MDLDTLINLWSTDFATRDSSTCSILSKLSKLLPTII